MKALLNKCPAAGCSSGPSIRRWRASPGSWCGGSAPAETTWKQHSRSAFSQPIPHFSAKQSRKQVLRRQAFCCVSVIPFTVNRWSYNADRTWNYVSSILETLSSLTQDRHGDRDKIWGKLKTGKGKKGGGDTRTHWAALTLDPGPESFTSQHGKQDRRES